MLVTNNKVLWQRWPMHRTENPAKKVQILWAPQYGFAVTANNTDSKPVHEGSNPSTHAD